MNSYKKTVSLLLLGVVFSILTPRRSVAEYDPLTLAQSVAAKSIELSIHDPKRERDIPLRVYLPTSKNAAPVVLFSHGLGGSRENSVYLGNHWANRGSSYVGVFMQHPGSDDSVWKSTGIRERMYAMREAASTRNLLLRCDDVAAVINQLEIWNQAADHPLFGRLNLEKIGMCGHSFGAHTTQAVAGQSFPLIGQKYLDPRIDAAVAFSPSAPKAGSKAKAFGSVKIPWMLMTGTKDTSPIGDQTAESRLEVFPNLPKSIDRYELVLDSALHSAFSDRSLPGDASARNPNHHRAILAISTAFWDAYLLNDDDAKTWLTSDAVRSILETKDQWRSEQKQ